MTTLRIAAIGAFGHYRTVFDEIAGMDKAELVAVAPGYAEEDLAPVLKHQIAGDKTARFPNHHAMLEQARPDVVIVSTRLDRIAPIAADAARAGCHIISEKPLAIDHASLRALHAAAREAGVRLIAMLSMRKERAFVAARECYRRGEVGEV
ncbi:MAG: Gfo/Idh/MocA family oxidoreductase, partial [Candidatus Sumerlaeota bacterium]|nr:Gfo/Idh/MocA family oxidoreductase [Candidatus Sumerlaeota bacterium]